jgi:hypothetical protein
MTSGWVLIDVVLGGESENNNFKKIRKHFTD